MAGATDAGAGPVAAAGSLAGVGSLAWATGQVPGTPVR